MYRNCNTILTNTLPKGYRAPITDEAWNALGSLVRPRWDCRQACRRAVDSGVVSCGDGRGFGSPALRHFYISTESLRFKGFRRLRNFHAFSAYSSVLSGLKPPHNKSNCGNNHSKTLHQAGHVGISDRVQYRSTIFKNWSNAWLTTEH